MAKRPLVMAAMATTLSLVITACGSSQQAQPAPSQTQTSAANQATQGTQNSQPAQSAQVTGEIWIDGSSTVYPITEAVAEEFQKLHPGVRVTIGVSGSSGGFKKWVKGELDINNSSRKIKQAEIDAAEQGGFGYVEIPVAFDGITVVVNKENTWVDCITEAELNQIWSPDSTVKQWNEVNPNWPDLELKLYGPGTDSGTFEYFTEHINKRAKVSRADYTASEDDNVLVQGVAGNKGALGYFGYAYYVENKDSLKALQVNAGKGCVMPSDETINNGSYSISRPIYIYPTKKALERPEVKAFVEFYLEKAPELVPQVGYTALPQSMYQESLAKIK